MATLPPLSYNVKLQAGAIFVRLVQFMGPQPKGFYIPDATSDPMHDAWKALTRNWNPIDKEFGLNGVELCTKPGTIRSNFSIPACVPVVGLTNIKEWECVEARGAPRSYQCVCDAYYPFAEWDWEKCLVTICDRAVGAKLVEGVDDLLSKHFQRIADGCDNLQRVVLQEQEKVRQSLATQSPSFKTSTAIVTATATEGINSTSTTQTMSTTDASTTISTTTKTESETSATASETKKSTGPKIPGGKATWILGGLFFSAWAFAV